MKSLISFVKSKKRYLLIALLIGGIIYTGQHLLSEDESESAEQEYINSTVEKGTIVNSIFASGVVETANYLPVTTGVNGIVEEVFVNEGDVVTKGDPIMKIKLNSDGEESLASAWSSYQSAQNSLESAKASLYNLKSAVTRAEEAFQDEKEHNSYQTHDERIAYRLAENDYLAAKADYDNQLSVIKQKQTALNKAWLYYQAQSPLITAPDSGTIANIVVVEGMDISNSLSERTSTSVASIKKEGTPIVSLSVSELDINSVSVGQEARLKLSSVDGQTFTGKVVGIDKIGSTSSGVTNYTVIVKFDQATELAFPAMGVEAEIIVEEKTDVLYVPTSAINTKQGVAYVTQVIGGNEKQVEVELGISDGSNTEIVSGLSEGDQILVAAVPTTGFTDSQADSKSVRIPGMGSGMGRGK